MAEQDQVADKRMTINKIYVKDFSFESPQSPGIFNRSGWQPKTNLNLRSTHTPQDDDHHEIAGSFCPNILFPYAREAIASMIQKGGFPEFVLQPINFDALFMQAQQQAAQQGAEGAVEAH